jgi:chromosome segregation ATPase
LVASKKKKKGKKKANGQSGGGAAPAETNGGKEVVEEDEDEDEAETPQAQASDQAPSTQASEPPAEQSAPADEKDLPIRNGTAPPTQAEDTQVEEEASQSKDDTTSSTDTTARLDAMQQERDTLRAQVAEMRKSLEELQEKHTEEISGVKEELEQTQESKEHAETQYRNLLGKVNTIRSQLGERLKADAAELEQARERIEELENSQKATQEENEKLEESISDLTKELSTQSTEIESLRSRTNLSSSNFAKERDDLLSQQAYLREEYEVAKQAMQDWEILATEERSRREALSERTQELEDQLQTLRESYERAQSDSETQNTTVDGLQRALRDLQDERKRELREMVESTQSQLESLRTQTTTAETTAADLTTQLESLQAELLRLAPFEKEVKEKNLLIGKLRHEAVILNDHLTKALRFLKRGKPEDNVDRQLVSNHFLQFLQLERSDPKKFQVLQLIAALLGWDEAQREQAGLVRSGQPSGFTLANPTGSLRVPLSPFRRMSSTPTLNNDFSPLSPGLEGKESLAELWSEFLEREAESGTGSAGQSRRGSVRSMQSGVTSPVGPRPGESRRKESLSGLGLTVKTPPAT